MKIYIGADHRGFRLKEKLKSFLEKLDYSVIDLGNKKYDPKDDYPIYSAIVGKIVSKDKGSAGILICGSGQGVCIAANKIKGIRAALASNAKDAYLSRNDDDCNIVCLQGDYTSLDKAKKIVKKFLNTKFSEEERHIKRIEEIRKLEK